MAPVLAVDLAAPPRQSFEVPARPDVFGRPIERIPARQGLGAVFDPRRISPVSTDPVDAELARIRPAVRDLHAIGFVGKMIGGETLTQPHRGQHQRTAGQATYNELARLFASPRYRAASPRI